jgi:organic radical activating enzyme
VPVLRYRFRRHRRRARRQVQGRRALAAEIDGLWPATHAASKYVVFTGGEPLLQLDKR